MFRAGLDVDPGYPDVAGGSHAYGRRVGNRQPLRSLPI